MPKTGLTERIRQIAKELGVFHIDEIVSRIDVQTFKERHKIKAHINSLIKRGEFGALMGSEKYEYVWKNRKRTYRDIIWHLIRSSVRIDSKELQLLSGAHRTTVYKCLLSFERLGYLKRQGTFIWILTNDPGPRTPAE